MKNLIRYLRIFFLMSIHISTSNASVIGPPDCEISGQITHLEKPTKEKNEIFSGKVVLLISESNCSIYKNKTKLSGILKSKSWVFKSGQELKLSMTEGGTLGEDGKLYKWKHWEVNSFKDTSQKNMSIADITFEDNPN